MTLEPHDRAALEEAIRLAREESPGRSEQIDHMIAKSGWLYAAEFAAGLMQEVNLGLAPHQRCPFESNEDFEPEDGDDRMAVTLLRQMLKVGVSRYHPDPVRALAEAQAKATRRR